MEPQTGVNFRPVLAGVFLLGFRLISTIVDITVMINDEKYYHANWIAILVVFAVSLVHKIFCHTDNVMYTIIFASGNWGFYSRICEYVFVCVVHTSSLHQD